MSLFDRALSCLCYVLLALPPCLLVLSRVYEEWRDAREYLLGDLRREGILTAASDGVWVRAARDSVTTDGCVTFEVRPAGAVASVTRAAEQWLDPLPGYATDGATLAQVERLVNRFSVPKDRRPSAGEVLAFAGPGFGWRDIVLVSLERARVWHFRVNLEDHRKGVGR